MFTASTPGKRLNTRASAASRRSQSRASSVAAGGPAESPLPAASHITSLSKRGARGVSVASSVIAAGHEVRDEANDDDGVDALESRGILLQTSTHTVSRHVARIPAEVQHLLSNNDFYTQPYRTLLDTQVGYACLIGAHNCHVFKLGKTNTFSPTCYTFPVPRHEGVSFSAAIYSPIPYVTFVSTNAATEPGLLMVTTSGQIRYWNSVSVALSGVDRCTAVDLTLGPGEVVRDLHRINIALYLLATSASRLFSVNTHEASSGLYPRQLLKSRGMLARVGGIFGSGAIEATSGYQVLSSYLRSSGRSASSPRQYIVFAISEKTLTKWQIADDGSYQFSEESDFHATLVEQTMAAAKKARRPIETVANPYILDAKARGDAVMLLLAFMPKVNASSSQHDRELALALIGEDNSVQITMLSFRHEADLLPLSSATLSFGESDTGLIFITTRNAVHVISGFSSSGIWEQSITMRDAVKDRILGSTIVDADTLIWQCASSGVLRLNVKHETASQKTSNPTAALKSHLEEAVVFGASTNNPLAFRLSPQIPGDLVSAAESVSAALLASSSPHLPNIIDMRAQLADRGARLRFLITYIHDNQLMAKLSKTSKRHLSWDAERLCAASALWHLHNTRSQDDFNPDILAQAIEALHLQTHSGYSLLRSFFRHHIKHLGSLLEQLKPFLEEVQGNKMSLSDRSSVSMQIVAILVTAFQAVHLFRKDNGRLYGIHGEQTCMAEPWSCRQPTLQILRASCEVTRRCLQDRTRQLGTNIDAESSSETESSTGEQRLQTSLKDHYAKLADYTLYAYQERLAYLQSLDSDTDHAAETRSLAEQYVLLRSVLIETLVPFKRSAIAFDLAERYRDFRALVKLCNDGTTQSASQNAYFLEKYKKDYAFALYTWYHDSNQYYKIVTQDPTYDIYVREFLDNKHLHRFSWLQSVSTGSYDKATTSLLEEAQHEIYFTQQKLMLSVGKLAILANLSRHQLEYSNATQDACHKVDDRLDVAASHERLLANCSSVFDARDNIRNSHRKAEKAAEVLCDLHGPMKNFAVDLFEKLIDGKVLRTEDLCDLYSIKRNDTDSTFGDYAHAIELLIRDQITPQVRLQVSLKAVWRRVYAHNDWPRIRQAVQSSTDSNVEDILRATVLYRTLSLLRARQVNIDHLLRPSEAYLMESGPDMDALRARLGAANAYAGVHTDGIIQQCIRESQQIRDWVNDSAVRLEELYDEVNRVVLEDDATEVGQYRRD